MDVLQATDGGVAEVGASVMPGEGHSLVPSHGSPALPADSPATCGARRASVMRVRALAGVAWSGFLSVAIAAGLPARSHSPKAGSSTRGAAAADQIPEAPPIPPPDDRYKADILVIVAHPDDETE